MACFKDKTINLGENTNNRLESMFSKIKSVCSKYASLIQFSHEFFSVLRLMRNERNSHYLMALAQKPLEYQNCESHVQKYAKYLTPYAFYLVRNQLILSDVIKTENVTRMSEQNFEVKLFGDQLHTTPSSCTCSFRSRMRLPCQHIFKVRNIVELPLFEPELVKERWTMNYYE